MSNTSRVNVYIGIMVTAEDGNPVYTQLKTKPAVPASPPVEDEDEGPKESSTRNVIILALVFVGAIISLAVVYLNFPKLDE